MDLKYLKLIKTEVKWTHDDYTLQWRQNGRYGVSKNNSLTIVYPTVYSGADQRKHQSSASLAFVWGIHRQPVNIPHKPPVTQKMFPFDDVIMNKDNWTAYARLFSCMWLIVKAYGYDLNI